MNNKEIVQTAMVEVFIKKDLTAIDRYWSKQYIQHSPYSANGVDELFNIVKNLKPDFKYEPGIIIAEGDIVMMHGRYTGWAPKPLMAVDIFKVQNGKLVEHWDVMQEEVPANKTKTGNSMLSSVNK
ncbi:MAG: hypothetical protein DMENIID0002_09520 [Rickettsia endosymbiont of Sergentomyia squamirostris]|uniref:SnoaL-like domain-containing protein n=1 Tax=Candidatus Tisiphia endosymbiont of Sergentomyia squamirostris TaxID=3113639 RepID=A0AAT9G917_9RICK